jgi:exo-beta-1,3-glucanase (GH17 family)
MTYTPYTTTGACKAAGDVMTDIAAIAAKGFTAIRLYGTDCSGLQNVGSAAIASNIKLILGIFIEASGIEAARPQIAEITGWGSQGGNWGHVIMLVVGNEAIQDGYCQAGALASFISDAKSAMAAAGGGGIPVTTTEPLDALIASAGALCPVIDVVAANIQSYFNGGIDASQAGSFVASQLEIVAQQCPGKTAYNLESGWPSAGNANGASVASPDAQKAAMADIADKAGDKTVMFSFSDDGWKTPGPLDVEQHFGCLDLF